jgi:hypothetical protein
LARIISALFLVSTLCTFSAGASSPERSKGISMHMLPKRVADLGGGKWGLAVTYAKYYHGSRRLLIARKSTIRGHQGRLQEELHPPLCLPGSGPAKRMEALRQAEFLGTCRLPGEQMSHLLFLGLEVVFRMAAWGHFARDPFNHLNSAPLQRRNFVWII